MTQDNEKPRLITPRVVHDQPLDRARRLADRAEFNFEAYANTFARLIAARDTETPLVLGVSGTWGSGKTTLLKLIQSKLEETGRREQNASYSFLGEDSEGDFRQCRTVWFNAWKYADEDALLVALVRVIVQTMYADDLISKSLAAILDPLPDRRDVIHTVLGWFSLKTPWGDIKPGTGEPVKTTFAEKAALLDQFSEAFDRLAAAWVHRQPDAGRVNPAQGVMVVFIDDLDRCLHDKAVQVLEAVKLFLDRPGVVFVLAADEAMIEAAIQARFKTHEVEGQRAKDYLEKFFQVRFVLPPISEKQGGDYLAHALGDADKPLAEADKKALETLAGLILAGAEVNPRQIKTFLNYLNVGWAVLTNSGQARGVAREDFLRWLALTRVGPRFCERVRELHKESRRGLDYLADAVKWANDPAYKSAEYQDWTGPDYRRLRNVLKLAQFSDRVTPDALDNLIFWSAPEAAPVETQGAARQETGAAVVHMRVGGKEEFLPGASRQNWAPVPAGKFVMGSREDDRDAYDDERPQHTVLIPYDYRIGRYPVTNAEYQAFVAATDHKIAEELRRNLNDETLRDHPVVHVSWRDARAYCDWLTQELRQKQEIAATDVIRLPTEAEWEKAARGEYGKIYPWGDEWDPERCNSSEKGPGTTTPVGAYSPLGDSRYGVADMAGNVWEWCQSKYKPYPKEQDKKTDPDREDLSGDDARVVRGGSFGYDRRLVRCACRHVSRPDFRDGNFGFRVLAWSPGSR